jgi:Zn-dependent protease with chaperone function
MYGVGVKEFSNFRALLIADPETTSRDAKKMGSVIRTRSDQQLVQRLVSKDISPLASFLELFSTHPNIVKRLKALRQYQKE